MTAVKAVECLCVQAMGGRKGGEPDLLRIPSAMSKSLGGFEPKAVSSEEGVTAIKPAGQAPQCDIELQPSSWLASS